MDSTARPRRATSAQTATPRIQATLAARLNLADFQNAVPALRELAVVNDGKAALKDLELAVHSEPAFFKPAVWHIEALAPGHRQRIPVPDLALDGALLSRLVEAERAVVHFTLQRRGEPGEALARLEAPVELLPRNHWGGLSTLPELVAAFVQPNHPAVEALLKRAAGILRQAGRSGEIAGYQDGAKGAWELASALWSAVGSMGLDYALPPASFEHQGQKVRGPQQLAESGLATCLDLALLFCAALEQAGLNPLMVFMQGHALAGVWLQPEEFRNAVVDDITALRKRVRLKELVLFETTLVTQRPLPRFSHACERGTQQLGEDREQAFELAVDIRRARLQRIKPLAGLEAAAPAAAVPEREPEAVQEPVLEPAPELPQDSEAPLDGSAGRTDDRLGRWQRKLLDLSLRNNLLSFKDSKKALALDAPEARRIEDVLASGESLRLLPRPELMAGRDPRSKALYESREREDLRRVQALQALERKEVFVSVPQEEMEARLVELYRAARATLQEGGSNTLYLALGFLSWTRGERRFKAPLILVPVILERKSVRSGFTLKLHDDEPRFNPTLAEMLRQDFHLELGVQDGELPRDDTGLDVAGIWKQVSAAIKDVKGWEVVEDVVLSTFSFAKYLMWKDLSERTGELRLNPVVRHLIETPREPYPSSVAFPDPKRLDEQLTPRETFCPLPADSSQLSAVLAASRGKDFVLIGPPGTGKSQTISNLIAQALAEGKRVLFVSEKMAALDVVWRRLRDVGLGDFCLELHSSKARKAEVLEQLRRAWNLGGATAPEDWEAEAARLGELRSQLNTYVERLHRRHRNGRSAYDAIARIAAGQALPALKLGWPSPDSHDTGSLAQLGETAELLGVSAQAVGGEALSGGPLRLVGQTTWSPSWQTALLEAAGTLERAAGAAVTAGGAWLAQLGLPALPLVGRTREGLSELARALPAAAGRDWRFVLRPDARNLAERLERGIELLSRHQAVCAELAPSWSIDTQRDLAHGLELLERYRTLEAELSLPYGEAADRLDVAQLERDWQEASGAVWPLGWWRRRALEQQLLEAAPGQQREPDVGGDIGRLVQMRALQGELQGLLRLSERSGGVWTGLQTDVEAARAALAFQAVWTAAVEGRDWEEAGLQLVAAGACGTALAEDLERLRTLRGLDQHLRGLDALGSAVPNLWDGLRTDLREAIDAVHFQAAIAGAVARLASTTQALAAVQAALARLLGEGNALLEASGPLVPVARAWLSADAAFQQALLGGAAAAATPEDARAAMAAGTPEDVAAECRALLQSAGRLRAWCAWRAACERAAALGLAPLALAIEQGSVAPGTAREVFETDYSRWWLNAVVDADEVLRGFVPEVHEKRIRDFQALDDRFTTLTRDWVRARLCANLPTPDSVSRSSDWGLLRYEMQKKARHLPLRELLGRAGEAIMTLTPCLLMSPLSIAQYLSAGSARFDIVVFDEASQIPVWDAIGAIARARQVVMVGDPKQLPPTSFFDRAEPDEDDIEVDGDLESILDECIGANLPTLDLSWHYRSRHESLIAFSNHRYYRGELVTFPSPVTEDRAVSFHHVSDGLYDKGGSRTNQQEAQALVRDLVARLRSPGFLQSGKTVGVVTFNTEQQSLIEDLLDEARRQDPALEPFFAEDRLEPVFVKNLESVQGDERDIMYFSLTYGPGAGGAVSMNFGPMNRQGGERRLNVAITRARHELRVFSSLRPEQMDLSRTASLGVRDLKHFMEFAEQGARTLIAPLAETQGQAEGRFEAAVAEALQGRGWQVQPQVGVSAFRVDLAVVDPDVPGSFLAGIECDGLTYLRSATARDRDKLRAQVLRGLGWELLRLWSTDWWMDPEGALQTLDGRLRALLRARRAARAAEPEAAAEVVAMEVLPEGETFEVEATETQGAEEQPTKARSTKARATKAATTKAATTEEPATEKPAARKRATKAPATKTRTTKAKASAEQPAEEQPAEDAVAEATEVPATEGPAHPGPANPGPENEALATEGPATEGPAADVVATPS
ncbi:DUF4011 domain-containing protein [Aquabacterium sp. A7-Y]|uniref:DUF4011 domain-containing protein n=1 Tax=Aquabacterium sp. A7-Y TaxID=1349605 RepID=UPI00223CCC28|nr:DUF4011 domain-containing protein [Aquabacterium sp. A7-Y]MCW7539949.1 DUF4011 domain-containing protein [Aquabacterium sp. A7-Y]